jgi:rhodanese-related sulfurtransferase
MDGLSVSPQNLYARLGTASAPMVIDVRRGDAFSTDDMMIIAAVHRAPEAVATWRTSLPEDRDAVVYCVHGK